MRLSSTVGRLFDAAALVLFLTCSGIAASAQAPKLPPKPAPKAPPKAAPKVVPKVEPKAETPPPVAPPPPAPEDLVVTTRYVSGDQITTSTVSMKGRRQRIDYGSDLAVLQQCDSEKIVQVNDQNKKFLAVENHRTADADAPAKIPKPGGTITYTATATDTGERKPLFGLTARHVKTVLTRTATPNACDKRKERVETDGWFVDPPTQACPAAVRPTAVITANDCRDTVEYVDPPGSVAGYPLAYAVTTTDNAGQVSTMSMEVTGYTKSTLPDSLFVVPESYTAAANLAQLNALPGGGKRPGVVRTCASQGRVPGVARRALRRARRLARGCGTRRRGALGENAYRRTRRGGRAGLRLCADDRDNRREKAWQRRARPRQRHHAGLRREGRFPDDRAWQQDIRALVF